MQSFSFRLLITSALLVMLGLLASCRKEEVVVPSVSNRVTEPSSMARHYPGLYLLNEGTMGRNTASLDYFDYTTGIYRHNIFAERNPMVVKELGDVANDLKLYGDRLWAVVNVSNLVEVMYAKNARHIGQISIPNCRYIAFDGGFAYISSYAGPIQIDPNARLGKVIKVDTATLQIVGECTVGYQPEELVVVGDRLYVANSGGYRAPNYDTRLSVIDLKTFSEVKHIEVGINLHRLRLDEQGQLWISSRGDYKTIAPNLYVLDTKTDQLLTPEGLGIACSDLAIVGHDLYLYGYSHLPNSQKTNYALLDTRTRAIKSERILDGTAARIRTPYGIAVNPETREIFVTDAGDYVAPGRVYCFSASGQYQWSTEAGVLPSKIVFTPFRLSDSTDVPSTPDTYPKGRNPYVSKVLAYVPAPGQFVNKMPRSEAGDTQQTMNAKVLAAIGRQSPKQKGNELITLGGWGGYVVVGFDHRIENREGLCDFRVLGNAFERASEAGVIMVAEDKNGNGQPDEDEWYEIAGSGEQPEREAFYEQARKAGNDLGIYHGYRLTYYRPTDEPEAPSDRTIDYIRWTDSFGKSGYVQKNSYHTQSYYPTWLGREISFEGTKLPHNVINEKPENPYDGLFVRHSFRYGYADNHPNTADGSAIDIAWAVDRNRKPVQLSGIDFIKIYTGVMSDNGWIGESSTEIEGVEDLHLLGVSISSAKLVK